MNLLKKIFEKRRARQIRRAREKYFDMFMGDKRASVLAYGELQVCKDAAEEVAAWLYGETKSPCPSCAHTPQSSRCPG